MITLIRAAWQDKLRVPMFVGLSTDGYPSSDDPAVINGARINHIDNGKKYEYSVDDDTWYEVPQSGGGGGGEGQVIDVGSYQYVYDTYSLPAIPVEKLQIIYANHKASIPQVVKWTLLGSETYFAVISADYVVGTYSVDVLVHNKYHCQYSWTADSTGNINPEVSSCGTAEDIVYDNTESGLDAGTVQSAIDELNTKKVDYTSKLSQITGVMSDAEKTIVWKRLNSTKTTLDAVAVPNAKYFLGEQSAVSLVLPSPSTPAAAGDPEAGMEISCVFYSGATATTLTVTGDVLGDTPTPAANQRVEINALFDGVYWTLVSNVVDVPTEETADE